MPVKAKFTCQNVIDTIFHFSGNGVSEQRKVSFCAVYGNNGENKTFSKATPSGNLDMVIDKDALAYDYFEPGKSYYLTIDEAPE